MIVDTDVLIDAGRGLGEAVACLQQIEQQSVIINSPCAPLMPGVKPFNRFGDSVISIEENKAKDEYDQ